MKLAPHTYCPALGWRQGEYQALFRLTDPVKNAVAPIITIPSIEYDFEERKPKRTVEEHIEPFARRFQQKWRTRFAWVAANPLLQQAGLAEGIDVITRVFTELRAAKCQAIPASSLRDTAAVVKAIGAIVAVDGRGCAIRVSLEYFMRPTFTSDMGALITQLGLKPGEIDFILDLMTPAFEPYDVFAGIVVSKLQKTALAQGSRNLILIGSAIPPSFKDIEVPGGELMRHDWLFYNSVLKACPEGTRRPLYGDYTIVSPNFAVLDMRKIKAPGKIVYTNENKWIVRKGGAFRANPEQMHGHCQAIVSSGAFSGAAYSHGDEYIAKCALKQEGPSNPTRWKQVAINHHISLAVDQIASLASAA